MLDVLTEVLVAVLVFLFGAFLAAVAGAIFIAAIFWLQNGGRDD
jgi:hypothetical protein